MKETDWIELEVGLDVRVDEAGNVQIETNTESGHTSTQLEIMPDCAKKLRDFLIENFPLPPESVTAASLLEVDN